MGLVGRLEELSLFDIFRLVALSKRTGKLTLSRREGNGIIVFRGGKIIYSASDSIRDTLGNILISKNLITESNLLAALEEQHRSPEARRLGAILVDMGHLTRETLETVLREQIQKVISEFVAWKTGFLRFEMMEIPETQDIEVDAKDLLLEGGLSSDAAMKEAQRRLEEMPPAPARPEFPEPPPGPPQISLSEVSPPGVPPPSPPSDFQALSALKAALAEIRSPYFTGEISLLLLRYAAQIVNRGVIFGIRKDGLAGMGQCGVQLPGVSADERVRAIKIPLDGPSLFFEVIETKQPYRGKLESTRWNDYLVEQLGGQLPNEVIAIPMTVNGGVVITLYGDNLPDNAPIGPIDGLELLMTEVGLDMERNLLETRIKSLDRKPKKR